MPLPVKIVISFRSPDSGTLPALGFDQASGFGSGESQSRHGASNMLRNRADGAHTFRLGSTHGRDHHEWAGARRGHAPLGAIANESTDALSRRISQAYPSFTNQQCVELARKVAGISEGVVDWRRGTGVSDAKLPVGTPLATFMDRQGRPSSRYDGGVGVGAPGNNTTHAAVLAGYTKDGILVAEQYVGSGGPHYHEYKWNDPRGGEKAAENYFSINNPSNRPAGTNNPLNAPAPSSRMGPE